MQRISLFAILGLTFGAACGSNPDTGSASDSNSNSNPSTSAESEGSTDPTNASATPGTATEPTTSEGGSHSDSATVATSDDTTTTPIDSSTSPGTTTSDPTNDTTTTLDTSDGTTIAETSDGTTTDDSTTGNQMEDCQAPAEQPPCDDAGDDIFKALGLNCSNDASKAIPIKNPMIVAPDKTSFRVATRFGTAQDKMDNKVPAWGPKEGSRFLVIGTGKFPALKADGALIENDGADSEANNNPDELPNLPGVMKYEMGSNNGQGGTPFMNCDGTNDCSDTLDPQWNLQGDNVANTVRLA